MKCLPTRWLRVVLSLAVASAPLCAQPAPASAALLANQSHGAKERKLSARFPEKPSLAPAFTIPVEQLGFAAPGPIYMGARNSLVSLDFLGEDRLLFTFHVPGLLRHQPGDWSYERHIRAVVLALPAGTVEAEALWTLHDRARYLWMLKDGHFLLRDRNTLAQGSATLELKPLFKFPGPLLWLGVDPTEQFLVTGSREPAAAAKPGGVSSPTNHSDGQNPALEAQDADSSQGADSPPLDGELVMRILRLDSGQAMLVSRIHSLFHLSINSDGYLESTRGSGETWDLNLDYFGGGSKILGNFASTCWPTYEFISEREALAAVCTDSGDSGLVAMSTDGRRLWEDITPGEAVWPLLVRSPNDLRMAQETLAVAQPINATTPLESENVKGQLVRIYDAADGHVALDVPIRSALDAGGNVAISPSGRRVAVLNDSVIQVFELPPPPPLSNAATSRPAH